ncbi:hypothetical protein P3S68_002071 [Capsicum galapagoense]
MKFEWGHTEVTVQGELNHPIYSVNSVSVTEELDGATFHTLEIIQAAKINEKVMPVEAKMSNAEKMVASKLLKYGYQPKTGLGPRAVGIVDPIQLKQQKGTTGLGYEPISGVACREGFRMTVFVPAQVPVSDQTVDEYIIEGIGNLFVALIEDGSEIDFKKLTICDAEPGEVLQNWTIVPSLFRQESCANINKNPRSTIMTCNESVKQNRSDAQDYEEYDESMMPENFPQEIEQLETQKKPNMDETQVVKLGDEETTKETRLSIHLEDKRKRELISLLKKYIDVFAWSYDDMPGLSTDIVSHRLPTNPTCPPVKQKTRKFKPDLSLRIKEEVTK